MSRTGSLTVVLCAVWGFAFVVQKEGLEHADSLWFAAARAGSAALVFAPLLPGAFARLTIRDHLLAQAVGLANVTGFIGLQVAGLSLTDAGPAAALVFAQPILVVAMARVLLGEVATRRRIAGALLGFTGVVIISVEQASVGSLAGALLLLGAAASWAIGTVGLKACSSMPLLTFVALQMLYGALPLFALAAWLAGDAEVGASLVLSVAYAGPVATAGGWLLLALLLRRGEAGAVSARLYWVPIIGAAAGVLLLDEQLRWGLAVGTVLVAVGVHATQARSKDG